MSQKKRQLPATNGGVRLIPAALMRWRSLEPVTDREELAVICDRSLSTVDRWVRGVGDPTFSDIWLMENHKPGLVKLLFSHAKKETVRKAARS